MKTVLVSLILGFGTLQTVSFIQCCCGPLCTTPGEICRDHDHESTRKSCTSCDGEGGGASSSDEDGKTGRCTHLSPASDLSHDQTAHQASFPHLEALVVEPPLPFAEGNAALSLRETVPRKAPEQPLYLLHSALLI